MNELAEKLAYTQEPLYGYIEKDLGAPEVTWQYVFPIAMGAKNAIKNAIQKSARAKVVQQLLDKKQVWGIPFREASGNPELAVKTLKEKRQGFVPNADGQNTDFVWGKYTPPTKEGKKGKGFGFAHIEGRRNEEGRNGNEFLDQIPYLFNVGKRYKKPQHNGRFYIGDDEIEAIIRTDFDGKNWNWLDSMYYLDKQK